MRSSPGAAGAARRRLDAVVAATSLSAFGGKWRALLAFAGWSDRIAFSERTTNRCRVGTVPPPRGFITVTVFRVTFRCHILDARNGVD